jgi:lantibiotic modifying enzyme
LWLDAPDLHDAVRQMARMVTPDKIAQDDRLDVLSGSAGALLGLLALYAATGEKDVIDRAVCCGEHLLACRVVGPNGHRAWPTLRGKLVAGMGHGAAGIAYALLRLVGVTGRKDFLDAAIEGFAFEQDAFSDEMQNWRGFGSATDDPVFLTAFCHGAPGIGLARLGALDVLDTPSVRQEIETALHTTEKFGAKNYDHLCCGHAGRMEIMAVTALKLDQPEWLEKAQQRAGWMLSQCEKRGGFRLFDVLSVGHPGLFKGTAGIGYQFLRLAYPDQVPSVLLWE